MPRTLINRYLLRELTIPTLLSLLVFTLVLIAGRMMRLVDLMINKGVSFNDIFILLLTTLPPFLSISIPLAFLMGVMIGMGRLSADNEIIALKTAGVGLGSLAKPVVTLAIISSMATAAMIWWLAPWGNRLFRATLFEITSNKASVALQPQTIIKQFSGMVLFANQVEGRTGELHGIFIVKHQERETLTITADSGRLTIDPDQQVITLTLDDGYLHREEKITNGKAATQNKDSYQVVRFNRYNIRPEIAAVPVDKDATEIKPKDLNLSELWENSEGPDRKNRLIRTELHRRLCTPLAPLIFALMALPFSTHLNRSGRSSSFICGMAIYLLYHFLMSLADTLTSEAAVSPFYSLWPMHALLIAAGFYLVRQANLERQFPLLGLFDTMIVKISQQFRRHVHP
jgi:lipopolysaccharide export system permease protein